MNLRLRRILAAVSLLVAGVVGVTPATARADGSGPVLASWSVAPADYYALAAGLGAMWAVTTDEFHYSDVYRVDPATNTIRHVTRLPFDGADVTVAYGSVWISDYYGNAVWRLAPDGHVEATVGVGLQPEALHAAFGSLWVANHHGASLSRVDPATNAVQATVAIGTPGRFRDGPQGITDDGRYLYAGSSDLLRLQRVDPRNNTVRTPAAPSGNDQFCYRLLAVAGVLWNVDLCTAASYRLAPDGRVLGVLEASPPTDPAIDKDAALLGGTLWFAQDRNYDPDTLIGIRAVLVERDPRSGADLRTVPIGGDATTLVAGFGDLWVFDAAAHTVRRIDVHA